MMSFSTQLHKFQSVSLDSPAHGDAKIMARTCGKAGYLIQVEREQKAGKGITQDKMQEQAPCMPPRKQVSTAMFYNLSSSQQPMQISAEADSVGGGWRTQHGADGQHTTVRQGAGQTSCRLAQNMFG